MRPTTLFCAAAIAALAACAPAPATLAPAPAAGTDPAARAAAECSARPADQRIACYQPHVLVALEARGVAGAMRMLDTLGTRDDYLRLQGHVLAHAVGIAAYRDTASVGEVFAECTPTYQSGCYHGVVQAYFADLGAAGDALGEDRVRAVCAPQRERGDARWLLMQCVHGLGHGLMLFHAYDVTRSLQGCDALPDAWEREGCYGGVFMENLVAAIDPHHGHSAPQPAGHAHPAEHTDHAHHAGHAAAGGHGAHGGGVREEFRPMRGGDAFHPCTAVELKYQSACYAMQTTAILNANGGDVAAAARACATVREAMQPVCFTSIGRDVNAMTNSAHARAVALCGRVAAPHRPWCHVGVVRNLIDLRAQVADGVAYCRGLEDGRDRAFCFEAVGGHVWVLGAGDAEREALCRQSGAEYAEVCRYGAGLVRERPRLLLDAG